MGSARTSGVARLALVLAWGVAGCATEPPLAGEQTTPVAGGPTIPATVSSHAASATAPVTATDSRESSATFVDVIDGDTIETSEGTVRIIGIDTPERGECGHDEASSAIGRLLAVGDRVTLELPEGQNDRDRRGRLIRYVITARGVDLGLMQVEAGNAIARYDSTDGYPEHPRQAAYHAAQIASPDPDGSVITTVCQGKRPESITPFAEGMATGAAWWRQYSSCAKLKRNTAGHPTGPFRKDDPAEVAIYDWFSHGTGNRGDGDGDGLACE